MIIQGMAGFHRRAFDGGATYEATSAGFIHLNHVMSWGAWILALAQVPFIINVFWSIKNGRKTNSDNPWRATTLDWATPTPPPHGNFLKEPVVYRDPYEYSMPGAAEDFTPQNQPDAGSAEAEEAETF